MNKRKDILKQNKRKKMILIRSVLVLISFFLSILFFISYKDAKASKSVCYEETSDIDYKVYLKDNPYYKNNYLGSDNEYLETLIDYIDATFVYDAYLDQKNAEINYSYKIDADVEVKTKNNDSPIYKFSDELIQCTDASSNDNRVNINQNIKIDYNHYNDLIKQFTNAYGLDNVDCTLTVKMVINVLGCCKDFAQNAEKVSETSLIIPLTTKTVDIDICDDLLNENANVVLCKQTTISEYIYLALLIVFSALFIISIYKLIKFILNTRTAEDIYNSEVNKIVDNYGSYIQKISNDVNYSDYEVWRINTFEDMLEISERVNQPILMSENKEINEVYFIIPNINRRLYIFGFNIETIKEQYINNEE